MAKTDAYAERTPSIRQIEEILLWNMVVPKNIGDNTLRSYAEKIAAVLGAPPYPSDSSMNGRLHSASASMSMGEYKYKVLGFMAYLKDLENIGSVLPDDIKDALGLPKAG